MSFRPFQKTLYLRSYERKDKFVRLSACSQHLGTGPQLRAAYARALVAILRPEALLLILAFPMMTRREPLQGPPFRVLETDLVRIFTPGFRLVETFEAKGSPARRAGYERWYLWRCRSRVACS